MPYLCGYITGINYTVRGAVVDIIPTVRLVSYLVLVRTLTEIHCRYGIGCVFGMRSIPVCIIVIISIIISCVVGINSCSNINISSIDCGRKTDRVFPRRRLVWFW